MVKVRNDLIASDEGFISVLVLLVLHLIQSAITSSYKEHLIGIRGQFHEAGLSPLYQTELRT